MFRKVEQIQQLEVVTGDNNRETLINRVFNKIVVTVT